MTRTGTGTTVSTTIELRRLNPVSAADIAVRAIASHEAYTSTTVGEGVYQFSRVYRPRWATISGWALTIGLLGAGYWLLLIKRTEACTMLVTEDRATVRVILTGRLLPEAYERLRAAYEEVEGTLGPSSALNDSRVAFEERDEVLPARAFRSQPIVTPAVLDLNALEREEAERAEIERVEMERNAIYTFPIDDSPAPAVGVMDLPEVRFENGDQVRIMGVLYVGSDPMHHDANGKVVERCAVADPTGKVDKTHFAMGANLGGLWVEDLFSKNGTSVGIDAQSARPCRPLDRVPVAPGEQIFFGDRCALVVGDDDRVGVVPSRRVPGRDAPRSNPPARV